MWKKYNRKWRKREKRQQKREDRVNITEVRRHIRTIKVSEIYNYEIVQNISLYEINKRLAGKLAAGIVENHLFNYMVEKDYLKLGNKVTAWIDVVEPLERW